MRWRRPARDPARLGLFWSGDPAWALPTMMGGRRPFFNRLCKWIDLPLLGPLLYKLNVNTFVVRFMAAGHVYAEPKWPSGDRLREKLAITRARGARSASVRFVTRSSTRSKHESSFWPRRARRRCRC
jgi:hypothetical protein